MREIKFRCWDVLESKFVQDNNIIYGELADQAIYNPEKSEYYVLQQYTGMKDKNGKEIWEGDVFDYGGGRVFYITYVGCQFVATFNDRVINTMIPIYNFENIGNIYENPELIKN